MANRNGKYVSGPAALQDGSGTAPVGNPGFDAVKDGIFPPNAAPGRWSKWPISADAYTIIDVQPARERNE